ncbi:NAD(+) diphosphatase [Pararhizobium sp. IMCC21322]|uniref:NAD(+) diphosphatase n=1 Tax=Pararhizobium sp. IMCC21322 TaxID=3067903 RepID=UPI0027427DD1|nr:NAD(+) diphosphatase [Pararhizobium sp. IMCC21322]
MSSFFKQAPFLDAGVDDASERNAFSANKLVRNSEHLSAQDLAKAWDNPNARVHLYNKGAPVLKYDGDRAHALFTLQEASALGYDAEGGIYLGEHNNMPVLAAKIAPVEELPSGYTSLDIRSMVVSGDVVAEEVATLGHGWSLLSWHTNNQFCANCGQKTQKIQAGYRRKCPACEREHFPRFDPVSIMLVIDGDRCLMGRQPHFQPGMYSCLAGFIEPGETLEGAVRREVLEEAGIQISTVRYHSSQPWPFPHTLMIGCFAKAASTDIIMDVTELEDCRWFSRDEVGKMLTREQELKTPPPMAIANQLIQTFYDVSG